MQVGPAYWDCVTTDSCGVPSGGRFGNVKWFENKAKNRGLLICWSRRYHCFAIYTIHAGKHVWQLTLRRPSSKATYGDVMPFSHRLLVELCNIREQDCRRSGATLLAEIAQKKRDHKAELRREAEHTDEDCIDELMRRTRLRMGQVTRNEVALPKVVPISKPKSTGRIVVAR